MGYWVDLNSAYITLTNEYIESVWWALKTLFDKVTGRTVMERTISSIIPEISQVEHQFAVLEQELATSSIDSTHGDELIPGGSRRQSQLAELIGQKQELKIGQLSGSFSLSATDATHVAFSLPQ